METSCATPGERSESNIDHCSELKSIHRWAVGNKEWDNRSKSWKKPPRDPGTGRKLSTDKPEEWACSYEEAIKVQEKEGYHFVGFLLTHQDPHHVTDIDGIKGNHSTLNNILEEQGTYAETSLSGNGVHVIGKGKKPKGQYKKFMIDGLKVESYDGGYDDRGNPKPRFIVFTGRPLKGYDRPIKDIQSWVDENVPMKSRKKKAPNFEPRRVDAPEEEIVRVLEGSKRGKRFKELFHKGDSSLWESEDSPYPTQSEADMALVGMFAWATGCDKQRMDRLFRGSALYREKWDEVWGEKTYGEWTIGTAVDNCTSTYDPDIRKRFLNELYHLRMNTHWKNMNACHLYGGFLSLAYVYGKYKGDETATVHASIRNLNLRARIVNPDSKDHATISSTWKVLEEMGYIKEISKGKGSTSSLYLIPKPSTPPTSSEYIHKSGTQVGGAHNTCVTPLCMYFEGAEIDASKLTWFQRLIWTPTINKKQRFVVEQVAYGRDTLEELAAFFRTKKYNFRRTISPLLDKGIMVEIDNQYILSEGAIAKEFNGSGGEKLLKSYLERIQREREEYSAWDEVDYQFWYEGLPLSEDKIDAVLRGELPLEELNAKEENECVGRGLAAWVARSVAS